MHHRGAAAYLSRHAMEVSFVIPLYNALAHTREALRTLQATLPPGLAHEIIFVDDGSTDGTRDWLQALRAPCRTILNEENLGFAGACNRGAQAATGRLLFLLNNDLVFLPGWFEPMRALLDRPDTGLVGNVQLNAATGAIDHAGVEFNAKAKPQHSQRIPCVARLLGHRAMPALTGACCALRLATWRQLGGFDVGFRNGGEDIDLCLRARAAGLRNLIALRSIVRHHVSASPGRKLRDEQNSRRLAERWRAEIARLSARAWTRQHLETSWHGAREPAGVPAALGLLGYDLGLLPLPPAAAVAGADMALSLELQRWREILDHAPALPPAAGGRTDEV